MKSEILIPGTYQVRGSNSMVESPSETTPPLLLLLLCEARTQLLAILELQH